MEPAPPQWEYCQLILIGARVPLSYPAQHVMTASEGSSRGAGAHGPPSPRPPIPVEVHYDLRVVYAGPDGTVSTHQILTFEQVPPQNPFYQTLGRLGGAGWELLAIEPSHDYSWVVDDREVPYEAGLRPVSRIAHFKRPVLAGRRVDEPSIELPQT